MENTQQTPDRRRWTGPAALLAGGVLAGAVLAATVGAQAASTSSSSTSSGTSAGATANRDETKSQRPDEHLLTGTTADKVRTAALAKYPGATIQRVETDSDGVYEAHLVTSDGQRVTVEVDKSFAVTGLEQAPAGGPGGAGGAPPSGSSESSGTN